MDTTTIILAIVGLCLAPWVWRFGRMSWTYRRDLNALQESVDRIGNRIRHAAAARAAKRERMPTVICPKCQATCPKGSPDCHSCGRSFRTTEMVGPDRD